jgi:cytochrome o ubiquinol oxidase subunit 2
MLTLLTRRGLFVLPLILLAGCNSVVMNPSGDIARQQAHLIVVSTLLMLLIIVPVICLVVFFARRYRASNTEATYDPDWDHSTVLELVIWGVPLLIIIALGLITWISTHLLDPYRPLDRIAPNQPVPANVKPLDVQVVALDWKWLFIYPEQNVASVNELYTPVNVPVRFHITASTVMNSFFIPALAGQIYAMPSMTTTLNAVMNKPGVYEGFSANYSGAGFSQMHFKYHGVSQADFDKWVQDVKGDGTKLSRADYLALEKPSVSEPVRHYNTVAPNLFDAIVNRCVEEGKVCISQMMANEPGHNVAGKEPVIEQGEEKQKQEMQGMSMHGMSMPSEPAQPDAAPASAPHTHSHKE